MSTMLSRQSADRVAVDPDSAVDFRSVLGHFATGITVVTAVGTCGPVGFTCQSFSSLSLEPPLVAVFPSRSSKTWPEIQTAGSFCVNVLASGQEETSARFARSGDDKFAGVEWHPSPLGSPVLDGSLAWLDCTLERVLDGGDHHIAVARVKAMESTSEVPLLFYRGCYRRLA